jgi:hypothetical protein
MKKMLIGPFASVVILGLLLSACMAATTSLKVLVVTKEKTVLVNDEEAVGLIDFNYKVEKDKTITENGPPIVSYKGTLISGNIILKAANAKLDKALKDKILVTIRYALASKDKKTVKTVIFSKSKMTDKKIVTVNKKVTEVAYSFMAGGMSEKK